MARTRLSSSSAACALPVCSCLRALRKARRRRKVQRIQPTEQSRRARAFHRPVGRLIDPRREAQQTGFARTVFADDSDSGSVGRHGVDIDERGPSGVAECDGHKRIG